MITRKTFLGIATAVVCFAVAAAQAQPATQPARIQKLRDLRMRDVCILADQASKTYYMIGPARRGVRAYTSKDLATWEGPRVIYIAPNDVWGDIPVVGIWAPELHDYEGKYYLFLTFDTRNEFPEQWRDWLPRVTRGSQVLVDALKAMKAVTRIAELTRIGGAGQVHAAHDPSAIGSAGLSPPFYSTGRGGPVTVIPWAANARATSSGVGSVACLVVLRMKVSKVPAGLTVVSSVPGSSLIQAQAWGIFRGAKSESPGLSKNLSSPTSIRNVPWTT